MHDLDVIGRYECILKWIPMIQDLGEIVLDYTGMEIVGTKLSPQQGPIIGLVGDDVYWHDCKHVYCNEEQTPFHTISDFSELSVRWIQDGYILLIVKTHEAQIWNQKINCVKSLSLKADVCVHENKLFYIDYDTGLCSYNPKSCETLHWSYETDKIGTLGDCLWMQNGDNVRLFGDKRDSIGLYMYQYNHKRYIFRRSEISCNDGTGFRMQTDIVDVVAVKQFLFIRCRHASFIWDLTRGMVRLPDHIELKQVDEKRLMSSDFGVFQ